MKYTQEQQAEILAGVSRLGRRIAVTDRSGAVSLRAGNQGGTTGITARPSFEGRAFLFGDEVLNKRTGVAGGYD